MHWLSYTHADQALLRADDLAHAWDALVVPGTLAAYYFDGTGGFVLAQGCPYIIDPRTPLLQTSFLASRPEPRKSHLALAAIHDSAAPTIWTDRELPIEHWQDGRWPKVVSDVLDFQEKYSREASSRVARYSKLLMEATGRTMASAPKPPLRYVPPYWAVEGIDDPWWKLTREGIELANERFGADRVMPIIAIANDVPIQRFVDLLGDLPDDCGEVFCWASAWSQNSATLTDIDHWKEVISVGLDYGVKVTNLYGGYLSVLLTTAGLAGVNHGVGYSEQRNVSRLGETGAPPARYYVPPLRSFVSLANAQPLLDALPREWSCSCSKCQPTKRSGVPVISELTPVDFKHHFLAARAKEFQRVATKLDWEIENLREVASFLKQEPELDRLAKGAAQRLDLWADAFSGTVAGL